MALAQFAGQAVAAAAVTDVRESVRGRFARLLGRGDAWRTQVAQGQLAQTREQLAPGRGKRGRLRWSGGRAGSLTCPMRTRWQRPGCAP